MTLQQDHGIANVTVIGAGTMGAQIASLIAVHGYTVTLTDGFPETLPRAQQRIDQEILPALVAAGIGSLDQSAARANLAISADLEAAARTADLIIEAVREDVDVKTELFAHLDALNPTALLASNSSSIPTRNIISRVTNPSRVLNTHFFAPIWVRTMVEIMTCGQTDPVNLERVQQFGQSISLAAPIVQKESKGFIINRIWRAVKQESLKVLDDGVATPEDIDRLWMIFFQTEYPPFGTMDMVGLDVVRDIEWSYQRETLDITDKPSAALAAMIAAGNLGEKSGSGFYQHPHPAYQQTSFLPRPLEPRKES
ncbi:MAG TPA: 3-hydroxyacyl-CoA dehydrogenase family protein [Thermomicrobiales bacterium]|nr:3-hydroxyacyl-CoA dehydrogenase family protein [Thermomicrobiales bacterium]